MFANQNFISEKMYSFTIYTYITKITECHVKDDQYFKCFGPGLICSFLSICHIFIFLYTYLSVIMYIFYCYNLNFILSSCFRLGLPEISKFQSSIWYMTYLWACCILFYWTIVSYKNIQKSLYAVNTILIYKNIWIAYLSVNDKVWFYIW